MPLPSASGADRFPWRPRDALLAVGAGVAASVAVLVVVGGDPAPAAVFGLIVPAQSLGTITVVALLARRRTEWRSFLAVNWSDLWGLLIGAALQLGLSLIAYWLIVGVFGGEPPSQQVVDAASDAIGEGEMLLVFIGVVVLAPLSEELVFRGVLLTALRRRRSDGMAVLGSAAAFAALHLLDPNAVFAVPFLFVTGIVLGRAVTATGRLGRAVAIHAGFNAVSVLALTGS